MTDFDDDFQDEDTRQRFRRLVEAGEGGQNLPSKPPPTSNEQDALTAKTEVEAGNIPPPPELGDTPMRGVPALGTQGLPLPRRLDEINVHAKATGQVSDQAQTRPGKSVRGRQNITAGAQPRLLPQPRRLPQINWRLGLGCLLRMSLLAFVALVILGLIASSFVVYEYRTISNSLPSVVDLKQHTSQFETTRIFDRNENLLYEIVDPNAGRRTYTPLSKISPFLIAATIATEDKMFYSHPGFDFRAILRAFLQNYQGGGETISGASTITQQLARNLLFTAEERGQRTYLRKVREALLAAELTRRYTKDEIIELYVNEIYYGNLAYGVEAAAQTYFGTTAEKLTLSQASFLAGLPQAPAVYDIYHNRDVTRERHQQVLILTYETSREQGCIYVSNNFEKICVSADDAVRAYNELENYEFHAPEIQMRYPHWVTYVRSILEQLYDPQTIYRSGFSVYTTLDPGLQDNAERIIQAQVQKLAEYHASGGALIAIRPASGEILAMVGSPDFYNEDIDGQVNMATSPTRQPGSAIKPVTYLAAFENGWTPATLIWDVPSEFPPSGNPDDPRPPYKPVNYDGRFHGPVTARSALANSYNVPAVKTLQSIGIYDNPQTTNADGMISMAQRLGITTLTRPDYGLSLTLGGGEISLMELTGAYSVLANGGRRIPPVAIARIVDKNGNVVYEYRPPPGDQVIRSEHAFLISSILSDNTARTPAFGPDSVLNLPFQAAAKTGTTNDFRDNWTIGYTPDVAVGVWVGNADYTPMQNTTGLTGAAPIWAEFMDIAIQQLTGGNPAPFFKPAGVIEKIICTISGTEPSQWCSNQRSEYFAADQPPLPGENDLWTKASFDTWTGLRASPDCPDYVKEDFVMNVSDVWAIEWIKNHPDGKKWLEDNGFSTPVRFVPSRACTRDDSHPILQISSPAAGQMIITSPLDIQGRLDASADFKNYKIEYGLGDTPLEWKVLYENSQPFSQPGNIYTWDLKELPAGRIKLRLTIFNIRDGYAEKEIQLDLQVPTPTPTPTVTATPTPTASLTPTPTVTPTATSTPTITPTPTDTPFATTTSLPTDALTPGPTIINTAGP